MSQLAHPLPAACKVQFPDTVPSIRFSTINANHKPESAYLGHLPDGSSVQAHSADAAYSLFGIVMICHESGAGRRIWTATRYGKPIVSGYNHNGVRSCAVGLLTGA